MTDLERVCEAERLLRSVRDNCEPDPFPDLDRTIVFAGQVRKRIEPAEELDRQRRYLDALR